MSEQARQYGSVAAVQVKHGYFVAGVDTRLCLEPDEQSEERMRRGKLRWRWHEGRLDITALDVGLVGEAAARLYFYLKTPNREFASYSALQVREKETLPIVYYRGESGEVDLSVQVPETYILEGEVPADVVGLLVVEYQRRMVRVKPEPAALLTLNVSPRAYYWAYLCVHQRLQPSAEQLKTLALCYDKESTAALEEGEYPLFARDEGNTSTLGGYETCLFYSDKPVVTTEVGLQGVALHYDGRCILASVASPLVSSVTRVKGLEYLQRVVYL